MKTIEKLKEQYNKEIQSKEELERKEEEELELKNKKENKLTLKKLGIIILISMALLYLITLGELYFTGGVVKKLLRYYGIIVTCIISLFILISIFKKLPKKIKDVNK